MKENVLTGRIEDWWYDKENNVIWGYVYNDIRKRFPDGSRIHTSRVLELQPDRVQTLNSVYELGKEQI